MEQQKNEAQAETLRDLIDAGAQKINWKIPFIIAVLLFAGAVGYLEFFKDAAGQNAWAAEFSIIFALVLVITPMARRALGARCPACKGKIWPAVTITGLSQKVKYCVLCGVNFDAKIEKTEQEELDKAA